MGCWSDGAMLVWGDDPAPDTVDMAPGHPALQEPVRCPSPRGCRHLRPLAEPHLTTPQAERAPPLRLRGENDCRSAPPALRGFLERLLPSPPPRWADTSGIVLSDLPEFAQVPVSAEPSPTLPQEALAPPSPRFHLGKWARGSKVGAQVLSASELHSPCTASHDGHHGLGMSGRAASSSFQKQSQHLGAQVQSVASDRIPSWQPPLFHEEDSGIQETEVTHEEEQQENQNLYAAGGSCPSPSKAESTVATAGAGSKGNLLGRFPLRQLQPLPPKPRYPPPDFCKPPMLADIGAVNASSRLQLDIQRLCHDVLHSLPSGPETAEAGALLRRVSLLLHPEASGTASRPPHLQREAD